MHDAQTCMGQCIEQLVATVARLIYANVGIASRISIGSCEITNVNLTLRSAKGHPSYMGEIPLKLRISEAFARDA